MKYLKYFKESISGITLKEKLESIISMYDYIWNNKIEDTYNLTGKCASIFVTCAKFTKNIKPYEFDIECLLNRLENHYRKDEILQEIEELYIFSKISKFKYTEEEIENILNPLLKRESMGYKIVKSYKITRFFNAWYKKPCYHITINIDDEFLSMDANDIYRIKKSNYEYKNKFKEISHEFYSYKNLLINEVKNLIPKNLIMEIHDYTHMNDYFNFSIILKEV